MHLDKSTQKGKMKHLLFICPLDGYQDLCLMSLSLTKCICLSQLPQIYD